MIQDTLDTFCRDLAVTASVGTDYKDEKAPVNAGVGNDVKLVVTLTEDMTDAGSDSTVTPSIETDSDTAFGTKVTQQTLGAFPALSKKGTQREVVLSAWSGLYQYWRVFFTVANGNLTTGKFTAQLVAVSQNAPVYKMAGRITS